VKSPSLLLLRKNKREREKAREIEGEGEGERDLVRKRGREFIRNDRLGQVFYGGGSGEDQLSIYMYPPPHTHVSSSLWRWVR
jgi:hypothetical protein